MCQCWGSVSEGGGRDGSEDPMKNDGCVERRREEGKKTPPAAIGNRGRGEREWSLGRRDNGAALALAPPFRKGRRAAIPSTHRHVGADDGGASQ